MYKTILIAVLSIFVYGCAGMQPASQSDLTFDAVFETPGFSKVQLFSATKIWIVENFKSAKSVIEYEDKEEGTIIGNGIIPYPCSGLDCIAKSDWKVPFTMRVDMKDNKFRLTFSNLRLSWPPSYNRTIGAQSGHDGPIRQQGDLDMVKPKLLALGDSLLHSLNNKKTSKDW